MTDTRMTRGGSGSHWQGCEARHWDCKIKRLEDTLAQVRADYAAIAAELRAKNARISRLEDAVYAIADRGCKYESADREAPSDCECPACLCKSALAPAAGADHE